MNAEFKLASPDEMPSRVGGRKVSQRELARFLHRLAELYRDPEIGNPRLSAALLELARRLAEPARLASRFDKPREEKGTDRLADPQRLKTMDAEAVKAFIADGAKSKTELVALASERFSIPRAKLARLSSLDVRGEIRAALLHEESLRIIGQEAERGGTNRTS